MPLNPLTKHFINATIGWKEFAVIDKETAAQLHAEDSLDEFHIEPIGNDLYQLWNAAKWKRKDEMEKAIDEATKRIIDARIEKYNHAMLYLTTTGNMSEEDAREMLSMPMIRQQFGLT